MRSILIPLLCALGLACDSSAPAPAKPAEAAAGPETPEPAPEAAPKQAEPAPLPPAPEGTVAIDRVYVQTCAAADSCPALLQDKGAEHCAALTLGGLRWRLPTLDELQSWTGNAALQGFEGFHWSGSAWDEDPAQLWIFDPDSGSKTTARPDRKPFTIRCVAEPAAP